MIEAFVKRHRASSVTDYESWGGASIATTLNVYDIGDVRTTMIIVDDEPLAFALRGREEGAVPEVHGDGSLVGALRSASGGSSRDYIVSPDEPIAFDTKQDGASAGPVAPTLKAMAHADSHINGGGQVGVAIGVLGTISHTLTHEGSDASEDGTGRGTPIITGAGWSVRRLTPTENERLQGLPDDHTRFDGRGKEQSDSQRYRQIGNAVSVPVGNYVGSLIMHVERRVFG